MLKLLVAALIFLSLMLIGLVWLVAVLAKITLWLPAGVTALFVLVVVAVFVVRHLQARKASRGLEDALRAQAKQQARLTRPDLQLEVQQMQSEFEKAVAALKSSRLGKGGNEALYYLPWYTIIGPPGAGKSTALRNSGLRFPYLSSSGGGSVKGVGGTRNCDWWLTNQAVVLDTAGRWATQEEDHSEWLAFLGMVKRHRPKHPLNGLITALSVGDLVNARDDEVEALARRMRERIDEVIGQLHVAPPVYVLFTKCDLVEGFVEMFGDLRRGERDQVWGFTVPLAEKGEEPGAHFEHRFDELSGALETRSLGRMGEERNVRRRQRVYAFPQQFMMMRRNLARFISVMFEQNIYQETPAMRGVYFTSGTQEGRPFNLLLNRLAEGIGAQDRLLESEPVVDQKSYFLHDVFMNVIFEDRDLASASEAELKRQQVRRRVVTSVLTLCALAFSVVPGYAYQRNQRQLANTDELIDHWESPEQALPEEQSFDAVSKLKALSPMTASLRSYQEDEPRWLTTLGMYQGERVEEPLRRYYANLLRRELVQPVMARDVQAMTDFGFRYEQLPQARPTPEEQSRFYDMVKLHLLLSAPKRGGEPGLGAAEQAWAAEQLVLRWAPTKTPPPAGLVQGLQQVATEYLGYAAEYEELAFTRDVDVVRRARAALTRVPFARRALDRIVAATEKDGYELDLSRMIGRVGAIESSFVVKGAFTRRGWENRVRDMLGAGVLDHAGELWVLGMADGDEGRAQLAQQLAELSSLYFRAYVDAWQTFLRGVRVPLPADNAEALTLLRDLTRGQPPPIAMLMQKVHYNVQLKPEEKQDLAEKAKGGALDALRTKLDTMLGSERAQEVADRARGLGSAELGGDRMMAADVARAFEGFTGFAVPPDTGDDGPRPAVPYDAYQEQLYYVRDALQMQMDNPEEKEQLITRLSNARVRVRSLIDEQPPGFRPIFESLLWPPIEGASASSSVAMARSVEANWCNEIVVPFERSIRGRYPFDPQGHDLPLDELTAFYHPEHGLLWNFTNDVLGQTVELQGDEYDFAKQLGKDASSIYRTRLLDFLARSRDIASVFYPRGSAQPTVDFEVRIHPSPLVATTTMSVGGQQIEYHNGPEKWYSLSWPGEQPEAGASLVLRGANGMHERISQDNAWGLFRMIEAGTVTRSSANTFTVAWQLQTHDVTLKVDFRPVRGESPFFGVPGRVKKPSLLSPLRMTGVSVPERISTAGKPCKV